MVLSPFELSVSVLSSEVIPMDPERLELILQEIADGKPIREAARQ